VINVLVEDSLLPRIADVGGHGGACADGLYELHGRHPQDPRLWRVDHIWLHLPRRGEASKRAAGACVPSRLRECQGPHSVKSDVFSVMLYLVCAALAGIDYASPEPSHGTLEGAGG